ncbi:MBL fold metallo-hydrolase RNA specificity domain-containing protein [Lignipirellula cremea]|uniref:Ribonuclease n=1 Tax=Lignipirellula cremea TaxID=2528010 RepID=A0A518DW00_9BACT|nr:MBL fold metallo-hydrolase RNA specificity domain-containing protein [Lignipirellula cremea]QDU96004.1 Ribonuclease [Lignipirellula cremea]
MNFHFDRGLKLTDIDLAIDVRRRQPRGFVSHAHADHIAPHETAYCTPATAVMYRHRLGEHRKVAEMPFGKTLEWSDLRLTTLPSGHILGAAMLLAESDKLRLLYTGDFKLGHSATAERAAIPQVDILVMESTFGDPQYRWPDRTATLERFFRLVEDTLNDGLTPLVHAYVLGKAQEITRLLTQRGLCVYQHPLIYEISQLYEKCGCPLGDYRLYEGSCPPGAVVMAPPRSQKRAVALSGLGPVRTFFLTGWALNNSVPWRMKVDHALPLSDHADYTELLSMVEQANPRVIYCTHGPESFADRLIALGHDARVLGRDNQLRLFG